MANDPSWRLSDVARCLGVSKQRAHQLFAGGHLPAPVGEDRRGAIPEPSLRNRVGAGMGGRATLAELRCQGG